MSSISSIVTFSNNGQASSIVFTAWKGRESDAKETHFKAGKVASQRDIEGNGHSEKGQGPVESNLMISNVGNVHERGVGLAERQSVHSPVE